MTAYDIFAFGPTVNEFIDFCDRSVITGDSKAFAFHIKNNIIAHHGKTYEANICF